MQPEIRIFTNVEILADSLAEEFYRYVTEKLNINNQVNIALSGGSTPLIFFQRLSAFNEQRKNKIDWRRINFFWGDERCVPENSPESNFRNAKEALFNHIDIPEANLHRILGESDPEQEAERYSSELLKLVNSKGGIPIFHWVFLGVGVDGHVASIFPNNIELIKSEKLCEVSAHPKSGQKRVTFTGKILNQARRVTFLASGTEKQSVVNSIINKETGSKKLPASHIIPTEGTVDWYLDSAAAELI